MSRTSPFLVIPDHPSLTDPMRGDVRALLALPLRNWQRWNHAVGDEAARSGNCHYAATALMLDLIAGSRARGWRIALGLARLPGLSEPAAHSWVETPNAAVIDASQFYATCSGIAMSRAAWFEAFEVEPIVHRRPGQVASAVRRFGFASAALLPLTQLLDAATSMLL